jgi:uncharacterized repeat protein (TIGR02543 family)
MSAQSFTYNAYETLTQNSYAIAGYSFEGWATTESGKVAYADEADGCNITEEDNATVTLYAVWRAHQYTITFKTWDGEYVDDFDYTYDIAGPVINYEDYDELTETGWEFRGWYTDATASRSKTGTAVTEFNNYTIEDGAEIVLYAGYDANGLNPIRFEKGTGPAAVALPDEVTYTTDEEARTIDVGNAYSNNDEYTFAGWTTTNLNVTNIELGEAKSTITLVANASGEIVLTATWTANLFAITFDELEDDEEILVIATIAVVARPAIKLHTFAFLEGIFLAVCLDGDLIIGNFDDFHPNILFFIEDTELDFGKVIS